MPDVIKGATPEILRKLTHCLQNNEERLMDSVLAHAIQYGFSKYTSTLKEAWRISVSGLTTSITTALSDPCNMTELGPDHDYRSDPIAAFAITEAKRHRERGVRLDMFLGLLKYYRQSYKGVARSEGRLRAMKKEVCLHILDRIFDRVEIGFCTEWATSGTRHLDELQSSNRAMTNEKNKFLTIFESLPFPVILLDDHNRIDNRNNAASMWLDGHGVPGAYYYGTRDALKFKDACHLPSGASTQTLPEWLMPEIEKFSACPELQYNYFEKQVQVGADPVLFFFKKSSTPSTPPSPWAPEQEWGCTSPTRSLSSIKAPSKSTAGPAGGRLSPSPCHWRRHRPKSHRSPKASELRTCDGTRRRFREERTEGVFPGFMTPLPQPPRHTPARRKRPWRKMPSGVGRRR